MRENLFYISPHICLFVISGIVFSIFYIEYGEGNGNPLQYFCLENPVD